MTVWATTCKTCGAKAQFDVKASKQPAFGACHYHLPGVIRGGTYLVTRLSADLGADDRRTHGDRETLLAEVQRLRAKCEVNRLMAVLTSEAVAGIGRAEVVDKLLDAIQAHEHLVRQPAKALEGDASDA